jgi:hypothetical protein
MHGYFVFVADLALSFLMRDRKASLMATLANILWRAPPRLTIETKISQSHLRL